MYGYLNPSPFRPAMDELDFRSCEACVRPEPGMGLMRKLVRGCVSSVAFLCASSYALRAETIEGALARAYQDNPQLNAQRAQLRATDENVPQALSGYRPKVGIIATVGEQHGDLTEYTTPNNPSQATAEGLPPYTNLAVTRRRTPTESRQHRHFLTAFRPQNRTQTAESQVLAGREGLRVIEQTVLLNAATIYMDVLRDYASVQIQRSNVRALGQVLGDTKKRFSVQDVTATDVAQAQAQLAAAESALLRS